MKRIDADLLAENAVLIGLLTRDQLHEARADAEDGSTEALSRALLRKGLLTSWQTERLSKGEVSGFFYGANKVLFHLAEGTFARVYRGENTSTGRPVAIKVLRRRFVTDSAAVARFGQEAESGMKLVHPNIVRIHEYGENEHNHFMTMEYVEGSNLRELLKIRTRLSAEDAMPVLLGLARGLKYSHEHGVTHRDIKGTNILISNRREAKLVDFGLATVADDKVAEAAHTRTVDYSALERTCGSPKGDPRSDIYFLGCVYYQMLTGVLPLPEVETSDPLAKMLKRSFGAIKPIREHRQAPSLELCHIIETMMQIDVKKRYQTMGDVLRELEALQDHPSDSPNGQTAPAADLTDNSLADAELLAAAFLPKSAGPEPEPEPEPEPLVEEPAPSEPEPSVTKPAPSEPEPSVEKPALAEPEPLTPKRPRVLCVEAQEPVQAAFKKALSKMGYKVILESDPKQALGRYRESPSHALVFDADGLGPGALDSLLSIYETAREDGREFAALVLLGPRQGPLAQRLPDDDRLLVLTKPLKMKDVQDAISQLAPIRV